MFLWAFLTLSLLAGCGFVEVEYEEEATEEETTGVVEGPQDGVE